MATAIVPHAPPATLTDQVISYLERINEQPITMAFVEAMAAELACLVEKTGDDALEDRDFRYAALVAADEPVDFDDFPPALWGNL